MCGINGILNFKLNLSSHILEKSISLMNNTISHRGPDNDSFYKSTDNKFILGNRRLAIIDRDKKSDQPLISQYTNNIISFNGEIYNYLSLKNLLIEKGYKFKTKGDSEVALYLYDEFGINFLSQLDGMFAISIWDFKIESLFLVRDLFGKKPIYYLNTNNNFFFSSEIAAIKKANTKEFTSYNNNNFLEFIDFGYVNHNNTIFKNIFKLEPSSYLQINKDKIVTNKYDYFSNNISNSNLEYEHLLDSAVSKRMIADRKLGILLSGGVDSTLITNSAIKNNFDVSTFTINILDKKNYQYIDVINKINKKNEISNNIKNISSHELLNDVDKIYTNLSEPLTDISVIPTYLAYQFASDTCKVLLNGDGADEIFHGYRRHILSKFISVVGLKQNSFLEKIMNYSEIRLLRSLFANDLTKLQHLSGNYFSYSDNSLFLYNNRDRLEASIDNKSFNFHHKMLFHDSTNQLTNCLLLKSDHCSMVNSVEARSPFLDKFIYKKSLNDNIDFNSLIKTKIILRNILAKSNKVAANLPKEGFDLKKNFIYKNNKLKIIEIISSSNSYIFNFIDKKKLINNFYNNINFNSDIYWLVYSFIIWEENN